jgi:hypothetical protein
MAISQATVRNDQLELQRRGFINVNLSNLTNTSVPDVVVGSAFEIGGSIYEVDTADETPTGWAGISNDTQAYIKFDASAETLNFTTTAPSYSSAKGGWYSGDDRYLARVYKDASGNARGKAVYAHWPETYAYVPAGFSGGNIPFTTIETITSGSGNWTVPQNIYVVKVIATGAGGGGEGASGNGSSGGQTTFGSLSAGGGGGGSSSIGAGSGGSASGGDLNLYGGYGNQGKYISGGTPNNYKPGRGGGSYWGGGRDGRFADTVGAPNALLYGTGGGGAEPGNAGGGGGSTAISILSVTPGESISYAVGSGGSGGSVSGGPGADGVIYLEY